VQEQAALAGRAGRRVSAAERAHGEAAAALARTLEALRSEQTALLGEVGALRADKVAMRSEMTEMHSEVATLRSELAAMRADNSSQRDDNKALRGKLTELRRTVQELVARGAAVGGYPDVARQAGAHDQIGAPGGAAVPVRPPTPLFTATQQDSASAYYCLCDNDQNRQANDHARGGLQLSSTSAAPASSPTPPPTLSAPAVTRAAAPPPHTTPTVPPGDGRACAHTCARGERACEYACPL